MLDIILVILLLLICVFICALFTVLGFFVGVRSVNFKKQKNLLKSKEDQTKKLKAERELANFYSYSGDRQE